MRRLFLLDSTRLLDGISKATLGSKVLADSVAVVLRKVALEAKLKTWHSYIKRHISVQMQHPRAGLANSVSFVPGKFSKQGSQRRSSQVLYCADTMHICFGISPQQRSFEGSSAIVIYRLRSRSEQAPEQVTEEPEEVLEQVPEFRSRVLEQVLRSLGAASHLPQVPEGVADMKCRCDNVVRA